MAKPTPETLRRYAEALAWQQLTVNSIDPYGRQITAAFGPTARNNLDAIRTWIYLRLVEKDPSHQDLEMQSDLALEIDGQVRDRVEEVFAE